MQYSFKLKTYTTIALLSVVAALMIGTWISLSGVKLSVTNQSHAQVFDIRIQHNKGHVLIPYLQDGQRTEHSLGKLGEGTEMLVLWRDHQGKLHRAQYAVYFSGCFKHRVHVTLLPNSKIKVLYKDDVLFQ